MAAQRGERSVANTSDCRRSRDERGMTLRSSRGFKGCPQRSRAVSAPHAPSDALQGPARAPTQVALGRWPRRLLHLFRPAARARSLEQIALMWVALARTVAQVSLADAWGGRHDAAEWIRWARIVAHDGSWEGTWPVLRSVLPSPNGSTVEVGCGEERVSTHLAELGYDVVAVERSTTLTKTAAHGQPSVAVARPTRLHFLSQLVRPH
jgi:hypothetical protein